MHRYEELLLACEVCGFRPRRNGNRAEVSYHTCCSHRVVAALKQESEVDGQIVETVHDLHPCVVVVVGQHVPEIQSLGGRGRYRVPHRDRKRGKDGAAGRKLDALWFSRLPGVGAGALLGATVSITRRIYQDIHSRAICLWRSPPPRVSSDRPQVEVDTHDKALHRTNFRRLQGRHVQLPDHGRGAERCTEYQGRACQPTDSCWLVKSEMKASRVPAGWSKRRCMPRRRAASHESWEVPDVLLEACSRWPLYPIGGTSFRLTSERRHFHPGGGARPRGAEAEAEAFSFFFFPPEALGCRYQICRDGSVGS